MKNTDKEASKSEQFTQTELKSSDILKIRELTPHNFVELFRPKKNNWGSTDGLDKPLGERYLFSRENQKIYLDIPYEIMTKLNLEPRKNRP